VVEVVVVGEGQTEETFVRDVLGPTLANDLILLHPTLIRTSRTATGGALAYRRVLYFLRNTLRQRADTYVTTFFDLYGLDDEFPGYVEGRGLNDPRAWARLVETRFGQAVVREARCREDRFFAHVQPYEFEALLYSDVRRLVEIEPEWARFVAQLLAARAAAETPEHIDDGPDTHPSERLARILRPRYVKVLHGPRAVLHIGLPRIVRECHHFAEWLNRLHGLRPLVRPEATASEGGKA
jgi:hypothetical protein